MSPDAPARHSSAFLEEVIRETPKGGEKLITCLQCGSCGGSCPNGPDMQHTPRTLFAMINAGEKDVVLTSNTMWCCVSCYYCTVRCPQEIPITDIMYSLKRIAIREGKDRNTDAPALARTFIDNIHKYGRSFELGLASRFYFFNKPASMLRLGPLGLSLFRRGRMALKPNRIRELGELKAIIGKARELGGAR